MVKLNYFFFENKSTVDLAKELLGKVLVYETENGIIKGVINETEAYTEDDESCHAYRGNKTKKNEVMFKSAGHLYVYFTYGIHFCCNIVTGIEGKGEAVLIRSVIPLQGMDLMIENRNGNNKNIADGPAKLCQAFNFNKSLNGINLLKDKSKIYLDDLGFFCENIKQTKRIGISKAKDLKWRFYCKSYK